jgi:hypothetical protein
MMAMLAASAAPAMADTNNGLFFGVGNNDGCCGINHDDFDFDFDNNDNLLFFPTFGFTPLFNNRVVFDDVTFRNVRENSPRDDTCVLRDNGLFLNDAGLRCFF